jgi:hypothetical protein
MRVGRKSGVISVAFMQQSGFVGSTLGRRGNKRSSIGLFTLSSIIRRRPKGDMMGDDNVLLDHARRYFTQAGQSRDIKKMRMLAELGFEYLRLVQNGGRARTRAPAEPPATPPPAPDQGGTGRDDK